jgi:hypothetical protein
MRHTSMKAGAFVLAFGGFALSDQAFALSSLPIDRTATIALPVTDDEEKAVEEHLNPAEAQPGPQDQAAPGSPAAEAGKSEAGKEGGDVEEQELQNMFPSTDWPKK